MAFINMDIRKYRKYVVPQTAYWRFPLDHQSVEWVRQGHAFYIDDEHVVTGYRYHSINGPVFFSVYSLAFERRHRRVKRQINTVVKYIVAGIRVQWYRNVLKEHTALSEDAIGYITEYLYDPFL